jgi:hypothetical protein
MEIEEPVCLQEHLEVVFLRVAGEGNLEAVRNLAEVEKVYIDFQDYRKRTALHIACAKGHFESTKFKFQDIYNNIRLFFPDSCEILSFTRSRN